MAQDLHLQVRDCLCNEGMEHTLRFGWEKYYMIVRSFSMLEECELVIFGSFKGQPVASTYFDGCELAGPSWREFRFTYFRGLSRRSSISLGLRRNLLSRLTAGYQCCSMHRQHWKTPKGEGLAAETWHTIKMQLSVFKYIKANSRRRVHPRSLPRLAALRASTMELPTSNRLTFSYISPLDPTAPSTNLLGFSRAIDQSLPS